MTSTAFWAWENSVLQAEATGLEFFLSPRRVKFSFAQAQRQGFACQTVAASADSLINTDNVRYDIFPLLHFTEASSQST